MIRLFTTAVLLVFMGACDVILNGLPEADLCTSDTIPETPEGVTDAEVEAEIVAMCLDQERDR